MYKFNFGYIYKIVNKINNKIYIGQVYNKSIYNRFNRHCVEAKSNSKSYIDRAINKYGKDNFSIELVEQCYSKQELDEKEKYWIKYYNSTNSTIGYNLTYGGDGGNTYLCKSNKEMQSIRKKISTSNTGKNNGMSVPIKIKSIITNTEYHFDTLQACIDFFNISNKSILTNKARKIDNTLFRKEWLIAYENEEYQNYEFPNEHSRGTKVKLTNLQTNEIILFGSRNAVYKYLKLNGRLKFVDNILYYEQYKLELLK